MVHRSYRRNRFRRMARGVVPLALAGALCQAAETQARAGDQPGGEVQRFCSNIADAARDRRYALQAEKLESLKDQVDARIAALEKKRGEYEEWLQRRDDFLARARDNVVAIYANMTPDAAAEKLSTLNVELAAAIVMKLDPRKSGKILDEMNSKAAAMLTGVMASAARAQDPS